ncbi:orotidine-5'-phosphate decarboxylase [Suttonella sp. R2A3]|uniref:orotidine-5'-phosphate decarboxylase n=1 Tax=Suttonella sp. R2A3 TaxID=2908648 RepID=UPI001F46FB91|nr:orotidine-5'-phosphate decarboxylase [Suttonella sp. R2A3]UJF25004.1 orotidine-5'-phosphate decarboxylase [Suttonella sp. R2A3]
MSSRSVLVALDVDSYDKAMHLAECCSPKLCRMKVGKALFTRCGPSVVQGLHDLGHEVFLDLKYHDIPNTVAEAVQAAADLGVWMVNVHASGGEAMMRAAVNALDGYERKPLLIGVTVLTSMSQDELPALGVARALNDHVSALTQLTADAGLDGVVCSAQEASAVKAAHGAGFYTVTPGIRPAWAAKNDQSRVMTPREAVAAGSDYLVIGRPISRAKDPAAALARVHKELVGEA